MARDLGTLLRTLTKEHRATPACDGAAEIRAFEVRTRTKLPNDVKAFFRKYASARIFGDCYRILPLKQVKRVRIAAAGLDDDEVCPASWYALVDVEDGNYVGIDLASRGGRMLDCFHETLDRSKVVAKSFTEFLDRALAFGPEHYYLAPRGTKAAKPIARPDPNALPFEKLAAKRIEIGAKVAREAGHPLGAYYHVEISMKPVTLRKETIHPRLVFDWMKLGVRDPRRLHGMVLEGAKAKGVLEYHVGSKRMRVPTTHARLELARTGSKMRLRYEATLRPKTGEVTLQGKGDVKFEVTVWLSAVGLRWEAPKDRKIAAAEACVKKHFDRARFGDPVVHNYAVSFPLRTS